MLEVGDKVIVQKGLKKGKIIGKRNKEGGCIFEIQFPGIAKSIIYTEKQLIKI